DAATVGGEKAVDDVEQRGLAGAVRTDDAVDRSCLDLQAHAIDGFEAAERARNAVKLEEDVAASSRLNWARFRRRKRQSRDRSRSRLGQTRTGAAARYE